MIESYSWRSCNRLPVTSFLHDYLIVCSAVRTAHPLGLLLGTIFWVCCLPESRHLFYSLCNRIDTITRMLILTSAPFDTTTHTLPLACTSMCMSYPFTHTTPTPHLTQKQPGICHSRKGATHTHTHLCCLERAYPFDPLTGTWRISEREETPQSRSTSQRCALSVGSCRAPRGSGGMAVPRPGSHNSLLRKWGVSRAFSTSLWVRSRRTRGQTRSGPLTSCFMHDERHVLEYLHVSEGDANRVKIKNRRKKSSENSASLSTKTLCKQLSMMQYFSRASNTNEHSIHRLELNLHMSS